MTGFKYAGLTMHLFAQAEALAKMAPTANEIAGWSAAQTQNFLLVLLVIAIGIGAYFGSRELFGQIKITIAMLVKQFEIQDVRQEKQDERHNSDKDKIHAVLTDLAVGFRSLSDSRSRDDK